MAESGKKTGTVAVRLNAELAQMANIICTHRNISISELLDPLIRPFLVAQFEVVAKELSQKVAEQRKESEPKGKKG